jgi:hypothetical protein
MESYLVVCTRAGHLLHNRQDYGADGSAVSPIIELAASRWTPDLPLAPRTTCGALNAHKLATAIATHRLSIGNSVSPPRQIPEPHLDV